MWPWEVDPVGWMHIAVIASIGILLIILGILFLTRFIPYPVKTSSKFACSMICLIVGMYLAFSAVGVIPSGWRIV